MRITWALAFAGAMAEDSQDASPDASIATVPYASEIRLFFNASAASCIAEALSLPLEVAKVGPERKKKRNQIKMNQSG